MLNNVLKAIKNYFELEKQSGQSEYIFSSHKKPNGIQSFREEVSRCAKCGLSKTRHNVVFGEGNENAELMFVGEAPGYDEDMQGKPFVGKAGMLLTKIIEAMGLKREDVYICNILKCRPQENRNPLPEEISQCIEYLYKQIDHIKPKVICGLGKFASQTLLSSEVSITRLRGNWQEARGIKMMPTFHPAYLLRNPSGKKLVWEDMKKIMEELAK